MRESLFITGMSLMIVFGTAATILSEALPVKAGVYSDKDRSQLTRLIKKHRLPH